MAGVSADVPISANVAKINAAIAATMAKIAALNKSLSGLSLDADAKALVAKIAGLEAQAVHLQNAMSRMKLDVDITAAATKIEAIEAQILVLTDQLQTMKMDADTTAMLAKLIELEGVLKTLQQTRDLLVTANTSDALTKLTGLKAAMTALQQQISAITVDVNDGPAVATLAEFVAKANVLTKQINSFTIDADITPATVALLALQARVAAFTSSLTASTAAPTRAFGNLWAFLARPIPLFGALGGGASITGLHLIAEAAIELTAVLLPASVALGAFGVGAAPVIADIATQMQNVFNTSRALNQNIYPLTGGFTALANAVKPEVYTLFGEGLQIVNSKLGPLMVLATQAGAVLDQLGARITVALTGSGLDNFFKNSAADLQKFGDLFGNIFGTVGNILKVMPGYAEDLLTAFDGLSKIIEALTAIPFVQDIIGWGLAIHGAIIWLGLAVTAMGALNAAFLTGLASLGKFAAALLLSDTAAFVAGLQTAGAGLALLGIELVSLGTAEGAAASAGLALEGVMAALGAVNPLVWIAAAAAGIFLLVKALTSGGPALNDFDQALNKMISGNDLTSFSANVLGSMTQVSSAITQGKASIAALTDQYKNLPASATTATAASGRFGAAMDQQSTSVQNLNKQLNAQQTALAQNQGELKILQTGQDNYNSLLKTAGGNLSILNAAGLTSNQILTASAGQMKIYTAEVLAQVDAQKALGLGTGEAAAALNAANIPLKEQQAALQNLTKEESSLLSVITGGQTAFNNFQQSISGTTAKFVSPSGLANAAALAKGNLSGLNQQSLAFSNTLYSQSIPAAEKLINALQTQGISQGNLTTVVATAAKQMTSYTGTNTEANSVIVAMINNAIGPGTVSLQNLKSWVDKNSTSLSGMNAIVAQSTINAATLANVLESRLTAQFQADLIVSSGATAQMKLFTDSITQGTSQTSAGQAIRTQLIADLEKTGLSATASKTLVDNMQKSIDALHGKTVNAALTTTGSGQIVISATGVATRILNTTTGVSTGPGVTGGGAPGAPAAARGMLVSGGVPGKDSVPIMAMPGELVVPTAMVKAGAVDHLRGKLPGFAAGGVIGNVTNAIDLAGNTEVTFGQNAIIAFAQAAQQAAATAAAAAAAKAAAAISGAGVSNSSAMAALQSAAAKMGWTGAQWTALNNIEMAEAGYNLTAVNPSSGAYGLAQFINGPSEYATYGGNANTAAGQATAMVNYIAGRYGNPAAAWAHEQAFGWYGKGGLIPGYAGGGLVGSLAAQQTAEQNAFASVRSAIATAISHPDTWMKTNKTSVSDELATLTARQGTEQSAYALLAGKGLTSGNLSKFATTTRSEITTDQDQRLGIAAPAAVKSLAAALTAIGATATAGKAMVAAAAAATGATTSSAAAGTSEPPAGATTTARLGQQEKAEQGDFNALASAISTALANPNAWLKTNTKSVTSELGTITRRQQAEQAAYAALSGTGLVANLSKFGTATRAELTTDADKRLNTAAPAQAAALAAALKTLGVSVAAGVIPSVAIGAANKATAATAAVTTKEGSAPTSVLSEAQYTADFAAVQGLTLAEIRKSAHLTHLWHLLHLQHLADVGLSRGGKIGGTSVVPRIVHDTGGWIPPGVSMSVNGTGQYEQVTPPGGRHGAATLDDVHAALRDLIAVTSTQGRDFAGALNSTSTAAASRGSYSARRLFSSFSLTYRGRRTGGAGSHPVTRDSGSWLRPHTTRWCSVRLSSCGGRRTALRRLTRCAPARYFASSRRSAWTHRSPPPTLLPALLSTGKSRSATGLRTGPSP